MRAAGCSQPGAARQTPPFASHQPRTACRTCAQRKRLCTALWAMGFRRLAHAYIQQRDDPQPPKAQWAPAAAAAAAARHRRLTSSSAKTPSPRMVQVWRTSRPYWTPLVRSSCSARRPLQTRLAPAPAPGPAPGRGAALLGRSWRHSRTWGTLRRTPAPVRAHAHAHTYRIMHTHRAHTRAHAACPT